MTFALGFLLGVLASLAVVVPMLLRCRAMLREARALVAKANSTTVAQEAFAAWSLAQVGASLLPSMPNADEPVLRRVK